MQSDRWRLTGRLLRYVLRHKAVFFGMLLCMAAVGAIAPLLPLLLAPLIDAGGSAQHALPPEWVAAAFLALTLAQSVFSYGRGYLGGWLDVTLQRDIRGQMAEKLLLQSLEQLQGESRGLATSRFMIFLPNMTSAILPVCMALAQETIKAVGLVAVMFYWQWQLALMVLTIAPIVALAVRHLRRRMKKAATATQEQNARAQTRLNEALALAPVIKLQGAGRAQTRLQGAFAALRNFALRVSVVLAAGQPITQILLALPFAAVIAYITEALISGKMSAGVAAAFLSAMVMLPIPIRNITRATNLWEGMLAAAREVFGFLDMPPERDEGKAPPPAAGGEIRFENVRFAYNDEQPPVLSGLCLAIGAQETVALIGRSGAGKTTLANLLPRFFNPQGGRIAINGVNIADMPLADLRARITLITQEPLLFDDTVAMNVAYPEDPTTPQNAERVRRALAAAAAADFVSALPQSENTPVGEGGKGLSGGQRQRLALARAFYRDTPIVILDEATSALDSETEAAIKSALRRLLANRAAIVITHRFSTIDFADRVAVLDGGVVAASGGVEELLASNPLFAELYNAQRLRGGGGGE